MNNGTTNTLTRRLVVAVGSVFLLAGCGSGFGGCNEQEIATVNVEPTSPGEGPQYTQPTMENLQGKPQLYPSYYVVKQYPNSRVIMANVKPNLKPGYKNVVMLSSSDDKPQISYFYKEKLIQNGWKLQYVDENPSFSRTVWRKKTESGEQEVEVRVSPDPRGSRTIQVLAGPYKQRMDFSHMKQPDPANPSDVAKH